MLLIIIVWYNIINELYFLSKVNNTICRKKEVDGHIIIIIIIMFRQDTHVTEVFFSGVLHLKIIHHIVTSM
jgi:hypothetical protein